MCRRTSFLRDERGAAAAEMALVLPMLLALMFTCLEGAHYLYTEHKVVKAVRDGARYAARQDFANFSCGSTTVPSAVETAIKNVTIYGKPAVSAGDRPAVSTWTTADTSVSVSCPATAVTTGIYTNLTNAPRVTVSAAVPYPMLFGALSGLSSSIRVYAKDQAPVMGI